MRSITVVVFLVFLACSVVCQTANNDTVPRCIADQMRSSARTRKEVAIFCSECVIISAPSSNVTVTLRSGKVHEDTVDCSTFNYAHFCCYCTENDGFETIYEYPDLGKLYKNSTNFLITKRDDTTFKVAPLSCESHEVDEHVCSSCINDYEGAYCYDQDECYTHKTYISSKYGDYTLWGQKRCVHFASLPGRCLEPGEMGPQIITLMVSGIVAAVGLLFVIIVISVEEAKKKKLREEKKKQAAAKKKQ